MGVVLGLMLTNTNQLVGYGPARAGCAIPAEDSRETHMIWMAAASDMMVHSVLQDKGQTVTTRAQAPALAQGDGLTSGTRRGNYSY